MSRTEGDQGFSVRFNSGVEIGDKLIGVVDLSDIEVRDDNLIIFKKIIEFVGNIVLVDVLLNVDTLTSVST